MIPETSVDINRFASATNLASWAGVAPGNNGSAGQRNLDRMAKGNSALGSILVGIAHVATPAKDTYLSVQYHWGPLPLAGGGLVYPETVTGWIIKVFRGESLSIAEEFAKLIEDNRFLPMRELIFRYLREAILMGKFNQGDHLIEEELAKQMKVSRTPIREAIRKLELEGLVRNRSRRGVGVQSLSLQDVIEIYDLRGVLEGYAAKLAAENISSEMLTQMKSLLEKMYQHIGNEEKYLEMSEHHEWHLLLHRAGKNKRLERVLNDFSDYLQIFRGVSLRNPGRLQETWVEHERITHAIEMGDGELAERCAKEHVSRSKEAFLCQQKQQFESGDAGHCNGLEKGCQLTPD